MYTFLWPLLYISYSAMYYLLHSNIGKEQHEKHPADGEYTREMRAPYLDTWKPDCNVEVVS